MKRGYDGKLFWDVSRLENLIYFDREVLLPDLLLYNFFWRNEDDVLSETSVPYYLCANAAI